MAHARASSRRPRSPTNGPDASRSWTGSAELDEQKQKFEPNPRSAERLTEVEQRAIEVGHRLIHYKAYQRRRDAIGRARLVMPRPCNAKAYLGLHRQA